MCGFLFNEILCICLWDSSDNDKVKYKQKCVDKASILYATKDFLLIELSSLVHFSSYLEFQDWAEVADSMEATCDQVFPLL